MKHASLENSFQRTDNRNPGSKLTPKTEPPRASGHHDKGTTGGESRTPDSGELYDRIAQKAYELFEIRGREHGHDLDHWLEAERLVKE